MISFLLQRLLQELFDRITAFPNSLAQFAEIINEDPSRENDKFLTWDELAAACVIDESVILETKTASASVELHDSDTRGRMVVDLNKSSRKKDNVRIVTRIDQSLYEKLIIDAFSGSSL